MSKRRAIVVLDESGSMGSQIDDVVGGLETFFVKQRETNPELLVTLVTFHVQHRYIYIDRPVAECAFTRADYNPGGGTALLDAVGYAVDGAPRAKGDKNLVVILTDGQENSSRSWTLARVKALIEGKNAKNWQFLFLGVGLDSFSDATDMSIGVSTTRSYRSFTGALGATGQSAATMDWYAGVNEDIVLEEGDLPVTK